MTPKNQKFQNYQIDQYSITLMSALYRLSTSNELLLRGRATNQVSRIARSLAPNEPGCNSDGKIWHTVLFSIYFAGTYLAMFNAYVSFLISYTFIISMPISLFRPKIHLYLKHEFLFVFFFIIKTYHERMSSSLNYIYFYTWLRSTSLTRL